MKLTSTTQTYQVKIGEAVSGTAPTYTFDCSEVVAATLLSITNPSSVASGSFTTAYVDAVSAPGSSNQKGISRGSICNNDSIAHTFYVQLYDSSGPTSIPLIAGFSLDPGQSMFFDGGDWEVLAIGGGGGSGTVTSITAGTGLSGGTITTTGTIAIASTGVTATSYGDSSHVATFTVNAQGQLTAASSVAIAGLAASVITTGQLALARGGTGADLSATGGTGQYVKQTSAGGAFTVGTIAAADLPGSFAGFANPTASVGLTAVSGSAATAMRSDAAPALDQSISPTWTGTHTHNPGTAQTTPVLLDMAQPGSAGQRDSHYFQQRGSSFDTSGHNADWRYWVDVTSNAGASTWRLQSRIDAGTFTDRMAITDAGNVTFAGTVGGSNLSGTNTGDQTITLTGDVTGSGTGSFAATIASNAVTDAKLRQGGACTVIGHAANSTGNVADIPLSADGKFLVRRSGVIQGDVIGTGDLPTSGVTGGSYGSVWDTLSETLTAAGTVSAASTNRTSGLFAIAGYLN